MIIGMRLIRRWIGDDLLEEVIDVREVVIGRMASEGEMTLDQLSDEFVWVVDQETLSSIRNCVFTVVDRLVRDGVLICPGRYLRGVISLGAAENVSPLPAPDYDDEDRLGRGRSWHVNEARADIYDRVHELGRFARKLCAVGWCEERVGDEERYCSDHAREESCYETEQVVLLRDELDALQGSILNLACVALAPYVRALEALDDSRRVLAVAQDANGESYQDAPALLERIVIYEGEVEVEGRGEVLDEDPAPARVRVRESFTDVKQRLRDLKRLRRMVAKQALAAGLEARIRSAIVYAGVDEGE